MKRILLALICALLVFSFAACSPTDKDDSDENSALKESQEANAEVGKVDISDLDDSENFVIKTDYCDLLFPKKWQKTVTTQISKEGHYKVSFSYEQKPCFDLIFDESGDQLLGTLTNGDIVKVLSVHDYKWEKNEKDFDAYLNLQDDINVIIKGLSKNYEFVAGKIANEDKLTEIDAGFTKLYYPARWKDNIRTDKATNTVSFYYLDTKIFDIVYGGTQGSLLGRYDGKDIRLVSEKLDEEQYTEGEMVEIHTLQDDINVLLSELEKDKKFEYQ